MMKNKKTGMSRLRCMLNSRRSDILMQRFSCRESGGWDVKLAMEFKSLQWRIISSIITSCDSGCKLLESELCNYTVSTPAPML